MKILYLTDLYYEAKGRNYFEEDLYISGILKEHFDIHCAIRKIQRILKTMWI